MIALFCALGLACAGVGVGHYLRARNTRMPPYVLYDDHAVWIARERRVGASVLCCVLAAGCFGIALVLAVLRARGA